MWLREPPQVIPVVNEHRYVVCTYGVLRCSCTRIYTEAYCILRVFRLFRVRVSWTQASARSNTIHHRFPNCAPRSIKKKKIKNHCSLFIRILCSVHGRAPWPNLIRKRAPLGKKFGNRCDTRRNYSPFALAASFVRLSYVPVVVPPKQPTPARRVNRINSLGPSLDWRG